MGSSERLLKPPDVAVRVLATWHFTSTAAWPNAGSGPLDISSSGTRREELLLPPEDLSRLQMLRKVLSDLKPAEAMELLTTRLKRTASNAEFLKGLTSLR